VLDDPLMSADDRELIKDLLRVWSAEDGKGARERIVEGLRTLALASDIEVRSVARGQGAQMAEVRVTPQVKGRSVTLADVGYGVSQVLPFLSQDAQSTESNLLVYQPEAHLHPLAQSRLADVFVASVKRGNRAYVETHSEHLVLRLQALIAGGEIAPERVRVFCVEHDGKRSNVYPMIFDRRGVPKTPWPKGFLDTGLDLARDLAEKRRRRADE
jgi:predicted ATPase